jgi:thiamine pyrophosphate-dependent acetolactate synthase large subunit-like protein
MQQQEEQSSLAVAEDQMRRAADVIAQAKRVVVFSGAGISAESASTRPSPPSILHTFLL